MDMDTLRLFTEVAEAASFAAVARRREVEPSSVSRAIAGLEAELGTRLLQRTTRAMTLTDAGVAYLSRVRPVLAELDRANEEAASTSSDPSGLVRITASVAFAQLKLVPLLADFHHAFPRLKLELVITDSNLDLVAERIDVAIRLGPSYRADVVGVKLFPTRYRVVASPGYIASHGALQQPNDLGAHPCIVFPLPEFRSRWRFRDRRGREEEVPVEAHLTLSTALAIRQAAIDGLGPALLGEWSVADAISEGRLVDLFPHHEVAATSFDSAAWLLYPSREHLAHRTRCTVDFLRARLAS
jgi:DNA-binding transcriptional LysR family regulator